MFFQTTTKNDIKQIEQLLKKVKLPYTDFKQHLHNFLVAKKNNKIVASAGLEIYNNIALLRSVAVYPEYQGRNLGKLLYLKLKKYAINCGVHELYLLTDTADKYFKRLGFKPIKRSLAPDKIANSKQFLYLCPSAAVLMRYTLKL